MSAGESEQQPQQQQVKADQPTSGVQSTTACHHASSTDAPTSTTSPSASFPVHGPARAVWHVIEPGYSDEESESETESEAAETGTATSAPRKTASGGRKSRRQQSPHPLCCCCASKADTNRAESTTATSAAAAAPLPTTCCQSNPCPWCLAHTSTSTIPCTSSAPVQECHCPPRTHVRLVQSSEHHPPVPALTGRDSQRFDGDRRLVCGCVAFRIDTEYIEEEEEESETTRGERKEAPDEKKEMEETQRKQPKEQDGSNGNHPSSSPTTTGRVRGQLRVLMVSTRHKHNDRGESEWIFCKGGWEAFESCSACARRECLEEGGVEGWLVSRLPSVDFSSAKGRHVRVYPFLLRAHTQHRCWAEQKERRRRWVRWEDVEKRAARSETRAVWRHAQAELRRLGAVDENGHGVLGWTPPTMPQDDLDNININTQTKQQSSQHSQRKSQQQQQQQRQDPDACQCKPSSQPDDPSIDSQTQSSQEQ